MEYCIAILDKYSPLMIDVLDSYRELIEEGYKSYVGTFYEMIKSYLSYCVIPHTVRIKDLSTEDTLDIYADNGYISRDDIPFCKSLMKIRNNFSHSYEFPNIEDVVNFYETNKNYFKKFLGYCNKLYEDLKLKESSSEHKTTKL